MDSSLTAFFRPNGVVVIGASTSPEKLGYGVARNLIASGYQGAIHFVSQKNGALFERPFYTNVSDVPDPVDLAILIVPTQSTPRMIEDCAKRGIKAAIIVSAGFREMNADGAALEQQCLDVARKHGVRLLGPNCIGTLDTHFPLDTTFLQPPLPAQGGIGFISHSGAFAAAMIDWARGQGFGFSQIVGLGNQADINEADVLPEVAEDEHTRVIVLYMESVSDGRKFVQAASEVTKQKPVIALKVGRFDAGQKAAASHTGALAGSEAAFNAAFAKAGVLRADTAEQMLDWARALETYPDGLHLQGLRDVLAKEARYPSINSGQRPTSSKHGIAILTNAGGPGVIAADSLETNGLPLSQLTESTLKALSSYLPPAANIYNPVDMLASASPETYATCLKLLLQDENVDGVLVILPPPPMFKTEEVAGTIVQTLESDSKLSNKPEASFGTPELKPVVIALMGSTLVEEARKTFQRSNIPTYPFPERAASALGILAKRAEYLDAETQTTDGTVRHPASTVNDFDALLTSYGIPTSPIKLARDENEAIALANELGFPLVVKVASPDILHKSDVGGVMLNIRDISSLQSGYAKMMKRVKALIPPLRIEGVYLQRQIPDGQEVIIGMVRDPLFGPLMMFGSGGVEVESLKDVAFALAPLNQTEAQEMIRKTWAGRKLKGFRSIPPVDEGAVVDVLIKLSQLAIDHETIEEIEINPLRLLSKGVLALDVRMVHSQ